MKKTILLALVLLLCAPIHAQRQQKCKERHPEELITTLTAKQKRQLESIDNENRAQLREIKHELKQVRDSIHHYISLYGDNTRTVNRLLEREAALQLKMNKLLYATKVSIDKVITPEQHREMRAKMKQNKPSHKPKQ